MGAGSPKKRICHSQIRLRSDVRRVRSQSCFPLIATVGGIDALGTIDPVLLANASFSLSAHGAGVYGDYSLVSVRAAALRVQGIITRIGETEDLHEAIALNTYARAELARLVAIRTRIKAAHTEPLSAEQIAMAAAQAAERQYMDFTLETLQ